MERLLFLTGAGISAESGIPTFRGPEGYWQIGSKNYRPTELATFSSFRAMPPEVWGWYLYRRGICLAAEPNAAHEALVRLEEAAGDRFHLITQNVDGLHLRAGHDPARVYRIHGDLHYFRCMDACSSKIHPIPDELGPRWEKGRLPSAEELDRLRCPSCGALGRPHVLFFDESYNEELFYFDSARRKALEASALFVIGTSFATNLPNQLAAIAEARGIPLTIIDLEGGPYARLAEASGGAFLEGTAAERLPPLIDGLIEQLTGRRPV